MASLKSKLIIFSRDAVDTEGRAGMSLLFLLVLKFHGVRVAESYF